MNATLINKVLDRHQLHDTFRILSQQLNTSELTTFLTHIFTARAADVSPASLRQAMSTDRFVQPSSVSPRTFNKFDAIAFDLLPRDFEPIELSPLAPLGVVSAITSVDHSLVVNTVRSQDVVSDCTNVLALHAASQRHELRANLRTEINFCASQRLVRTQFPKQEGHTAHFKILTLVSAGRDTGGFEFELRKLVEHIGYYLVLIRSFESAKHIQIDIVMKEYSTTGVDWRTIADTLEKQNVTFTHQPTLRENWNYYSPVQFQINIRTANGTVNLADGGIVDWTQKLLSDKKERLVISGFGTELFCKLFMN